jgi:hypothetical protein
MGVVKGCALRCQVRDLVFIVDHSVLIGELCVRKCSIYIVSSSWLAEVDHGNTIASLDKSHSSHLRERCSKTMTSYFNGVSWVKFFEAIDLSIKAVPD